MKSFSANRLRLKFIFSKKKFTKSSREWRKKLEQLHKKFYFFNKNIFFLNGKENFFIKIYFYVLSYNVLQTYNA